MDMNNTNNLPEHLGGQCTGNVDVNLIDYLKSKYDIKTLIDLGCGNGAAVKKYESLGIECWGVDGDWTRLPKEDNFILHDFTLGKIEFEPEDITFDCAYSFEFLEHVEEKYQENYMDLFCRSTKLCVVTAAGPNQGGHHHVNCRTQEYWYNVFDKYGFKYLKEETELSRQKSLNKGSKGEHPHRQYFKETGMVFLKK